MQAITTIVLDIAKSVFQVHGIDAIARAISSSASRQCDPRPSCRVRDRSAGRPLSAVSTRETDWVG
jgi:hypothetical protein